VTRPPHPGARTRSDGAVLTIGQLAVHVGVTVRAIRHYHQRGLLAEPVRDRSGYRRYDTQAVIDLIRIKTLADAGVPLSQVRQLLDSHPAEFAGTVARIDQTLQDRIRDLERLRRQLAGLMAGERLVLPAEVTDLLDQMRSLGVSERAMTLERDGWTLLMARVPEQVAEWAADKSAALADPDFRRLFVAWDQAYDWEPDDPRLIELANQAATWLAKQPPSPPPPQSSAELSTVSILLSAQADTASSPAWRRLGELSSAQLNSSRPAEAAKPSKRRPG
jgi:DNA-binding transcriptional MerR regulator